MIGWLQGRHVKCWTQGNRSGVLLVCSGVGYEVQVTSRYLQHLQLGNELTLWIHQVQREGVSSLFGFPYSQERDLFRLLIGVSGVGPQAGLALLHECKPQELIEAISSGDLKRLCQAQGIGKRTAERLAVDLRAPIEAFGGIESDQSIMERLPEVKGDLKLILVGLGYNEPEIYRAVQAVADGASGSPPSGDDQDGWLRGCLQWLSSESI
ncbi:Holliday junction branch migration protein RuvA [Synechococcus sp. M16CYN]|uniref:Holliday junction branch migration protein RuvA n=1 Tax=Synechococcus sp. M16CYN TaxID=3103139 RepID=UPI003255C384